MTETLTDDRIAVLVRRFYAKARADAELGPVFEAAIGDWEAHLAHLSRFWSAAMLGTARFSGNPMAAHGRHPIKPEMFDRWLALWAETTDELFGPALAAEFQSRAARIAESLKLGLFFKAGQPLVPAKAGT